jgi:DNA (cytosine-5)-methyltransferase 1
MTKPAVLSLFCGCGSFDLGFTEAGFDIPLALDISKDAVNSYNHNRSKSAAEVCDLSEATPEQVAERLARRKGGKSLSGIVGGAPCQSFSNGNVHQRLNDHRHELPIYFSKLLSFFNRRDKLDFFVFENVKGINSKRHLETFGRFKRLFEKAGFTLAEGLLDAADFAVPQHRPRVFVVGINSQKYNNREFVFPVPKLVTYKTVKGALGGLADPAFFARDLKRKDIPLHPNHWTMRPKSKKFSNGLLRNGLAKGRSFRVLRWDNPSWAVAYGNREIHVHPCGTRRLSVYEAMLLQGFPKHYELQGSLSAQIKQVSDSVPRQVGRAIACELIRQLKLSK